MKKFSRILLLCVFAITTATVFSAFTGQDSVILKLNLEKGKKYSFKSKATQVMMMNMKGQSMNTTQNVEMTNTVKIIDIIDEQFVAEWSVEKIKMNQTAMGMNFTYDSEHPENTSPLIADQVKQFEDELKKSQRMTLDAWGNIVNTTKTNNTASSITPLPKEAIHVGSTWTQEESKEINGVSGISHTTYSVTKITKKEVHVDFTSTLTGAGKAELDGNSSGTIVFDMASGLAKSQTNKSNISLTISQQGFSIPLTINSTTTVSLE